MDFSKQPSETFPIAIDYTPWLSTGETITSGRIYVDNNLIDGSGSIISSWSITGNSVNIVVYGGTDNTDYLITSQIDISTTGLFEYDILMRVRENSSCVYVDDSFSYRLTYDEDTYSLYVIPSPSSSLQKNTEYTVTVKKDLEGLAGTGILVYLANDYNFYFTAEYCPLFTTVGRVKLQGGPAIDTIPDDTIYRMIYKNSIDAVDLLNLALGTDYSYEYFGCTYINVPVQLKRYVECKTAYDLISLIKLYNSVGTGGGDQLKTLGDMTIKYAGTGGNSNNSDPNKLKDLYNCWQEYMRSFGTIKSAVRGIYDSTMGFSHPALSLRSNRVIKPVIPYQGNFTPGTSYRRWI